MVALEVRWRAAGRRAGMGTGRRGDPARTEGRQWAQVSERQRGSPSEARLRRRVTTRRRRGARGPKALRAAPGRWCLPSRRRSYGMGGVSRRVGGAPLAARESLGCPAGVGGGDMGSFLGTPSPTLVNGWADGRGLTGRFPEHPRPHPPPPPPPVWHTPWLRALA